MNSRLTVLFASAGVIGASLVAQQASASLIGDEIAITAVTETDGLTVTLSNPFAVVTTGPTPELGGNITSAVPENYLFHVDVSAESFRLVFMGGPTFGAVLDATVTLDDFDWRDAMGAIVPGSLVDVTQTSGPDMVASIVFDDDGVVIIMDTMDLRPDDTLTFDFALDTTHADPVIPEPATMALFGVGLAGIFLRRSRS